MGIFNMKYIFLIKKYFIAWLHQAIAGASVDSLSVRSSVSILHGNLAGNTEDISL